MRIWMQRIACVAVVGLGILGVGSAISQASVTVSASPVTERGLDVPVLKGGSDVTREQKKTGSDTGDGQKFYQGGNVGCPPAC